MSLSLILYIQFIFGGFRKFILSSILGNFFLFFFLFFLLSLLIYPKFNSKYINPIFHKFGKRIFATLNSFILYTFYFLTLPTSFIFNRRTLLRRRPELKPWIKVGIDFKVSTFRDGEYNNTYSRKKGFFYNIFLTFLKERNVFLVFILLLLLIISMFIIFAQSSVVAPFIYTIF